MTDHFNKSFIEGEKKKQSEIMVVTGKEVAATLTRLERCFVILIVWTVFMFCLFSDIIMFQI